MQQLKMVKSCSIFLINLLNSLSLKNIKLKVSERCSAVDLRRFVYLWLFQIKCFLGVSYKAEYSYITIFLTPILHIRMGLLPYSTYVPTYSRLSWNVLIRFNANNIMMDNETICFRLIFIGSVVFSYNFVDLNLRISEPWIERSTYR